MPVLSSLEWFWVKGTSAQIDDGISPESGISGIKA